MSQQNQRSVSAKSKRGEERLVKQYKEPKFVPYEPYKAAVKPIIPLKEKVHKKNNVKDEQIMIADKLPIIKNQKKIQVEKIARISPLSTKPAKTNNFDLKEQLEKLNREKEELEEQLKIQTKVNTDLKKLLVASVGEDLQARVQFLTEDKVKLAYDVHHYVQQLLDDHEELEKLSIQCDVWRSKFLASSLIVDELAKWKAVLYRRYDEAVDATKTLLEEQSRLHEHLHKSYKHLESVQNKLDQSSIKLKSKAEENTLTLASDLEKLSLDLYSNLVSMTPVSNPKTKRIVLLTPGQEKAQKVLSGPQLSNLPLNNLSSDESTAFKKEIVQRFHPNARFEYLTMNCCSNCNGEIKLL